MNINLTMGAQMVAFIILLWVAKSFIWAPMIVALDERRKKIAEGLAEAEKGKAALAEGETVKAAMLKEARDQAAESRAFSEKQAQTQIDEAKAQAKAEYDRIVAAAHEQIALEQQKAREQLREQVAALAVAGAEKILKREVDAKAHAEMLSQLKAQL